MRVVAGRLGGRSLVAPKGRDTRPTSDRVREALFQILEPLEQARVADLYAGTGALGIEALSRGAAFAVFVEPARSALGALHKNLVTLGLGDASQVLPVGLERAGRALEKLGPYDLLLCDPPWSDLERAMRTVTRMLAQVELRPGARLVIEHPARGDAPKLADPRFGLSDRRAWGDTAASIYRLGIEALTASKKIVAESTEKA